MGSLAIKQALARLVVTCGSFVLVFLVNVYYNAFWIYEDIFCISLEEIL